MRSPQLDNDCDAQSSVQPEARPATEMIAAEDIPGGLEALAQIGRWEVRLDESTVKLSEYAANILQLQGTASFSWRFFIRSMPPQRRRLLFRKLRHAVQENEPFEFETKWRVREGKHLMIQCRGIYQSAAYSSGKGCFHGFVRDVSDHCLTQKRSGEREELLHSLVENTPMVIAIKDAVGRLQMLNQPGQRFFGLEHFSWKGLATADIARAVPAYARLDAVISKTDEDAWQAHGRLTTEEEISDEKGELRTLEICKTPLFHPDGTRHVLFVFIHDVTARRLALKAIEEERRLLVKGPVAVFVWRFEPEPSLEYASENVQSILGYSVQAFTEDQISYETLVHSEDWTGFLAEWEACLKRRSDTLQRQYRLRHADGSWCHLYHLTRVKYDHMGKAISAVCYLFDQTEQKVAEQALRLREEQFQNVSDHVPGMLYEFKPLPGGGSCYPFVSLGVKNLFGLEPVEIAQDGTPLFNRILADDRAEVIQSIQDALDPPQRWSATFRIMHPSRGIRWLRASSSPRRNDAAEWVWDGYCFDITGLKEAEARLMQQAKSDALERLAGGIAHDFNNYLGSISIAAQLLHSKSPPGSYFQRLSATMLKGLDAATSVARQLLAFSKDQPLGVERIQLVKFIRDTAEFALRGSSTRLQIETEAEQAELTTDQNLLQQVVFNLVLNARQAMRDKGQIEVTVWAASEKTCKIRIADNGPGIAPERRERVFDPDFTTKSTGNGLGLHVVRVLLGKLGGDIELESNATTGASFLLTLPQRIEGGLLVLPTSSADLASTPPTDQGRNAQKVYFLEDDTNQRQLVSEYLSAIDFEVQAFDRGEDLLAAIDGADTNTDTGAKADIAFLLDITVRDALGGMDIAGSIRERFPESPICLVSGYAEYWNENKAKIEQLQLNFIAKPYRLDLLQQILLNRDE